jgi:hypothetical protein
MGLTNAPRGDSDRLAQVEAQKVDTSEAAGRFVGGVALAPADFEKLKVLGRAGHPLRDTDITR